jgi:hypothetical protein
MAIVVAPTLIGHGGGLWAVGLFLGGGVVLLGSVFYALRRAVCPRCKAQWLGYAIGEKSVNGWLLWLTTFTECPQCKFSVQEAAESLQAEHKA